jgi:hypothetical protein
MKNPKILVYVYKDWYSVCPPGNYMAIDRIPADNVNAIRSLRGINIARVHDGKVYQVSGYTDKTGMWGALVRPDDSVEYFCGGRKGQVWKDGKRVS